MAPVTALLFVYRLPHLDPKEFRDYIENNHSPLTKTLLGDKYPLSHTRYYTNRDAGFAVGSASSEDADMIAVIVYESEQHMQDSMAARRADGVRERIQEDEARFMDLSKTKVVVVGAEDVGKSLRE